ncbi:ABC transporter ATP-binding protein [Olivibacter domesticus]|uniref:ABC-2 type transport system ATP-binding protein n=1 Tax=Olivibacter domesticus TaxID=407022 RepID=A0A1H7QLK5_OLID1|nr:ABC transporter ATP-binding protein [Olivibacter domesticus]SEL49031.1 ABC-2 type transport system ATP-binding protein [Olivibacter domesticus]
MLELANLSKSYGSNTILEIDHFSIPSGIFWLLGHNGIGKTTLLKMIGGIEPFKGNIAFNGIDLRQSPVEYRRSVNIGEAEPLFPTFLKGKELIELFAKAKQAEATQVSFLLKTLDVHHYINTPIGSYSSGMIKKLSLILAFLGNPSLILLDEPLITLDKESQEMIQTLIINSWKERNVSFIISSHQELPITASSLSKIMIRDRKLVLLDNIINAGLL